MYFVCIIGIRVNALLIPYLFDWSREQNTEFDWPRELIRMLIRHAGMGLTLVFRMYVYKRVNGLSGEMIE